jgi:putative Holliday junction resolvase
LTKLNNNQSSAPLAERPPDGRLLAVDLGTQRIGLAVSDELQISVRPLESLRRTSWKQLLRDVAEKIADFDARALVIGLPLNLDGSISEAALEARRLAHNFARSLQVPVYMQDERLTSRAAEERLRAAGFSHQALRERVDSEAAAIILRDFISGARNLPEPV